MKPVLGLSLIVLGAAMLIGLGLAVANLRPAGERPPLAARLAHGLLGALGLGVLLLTMGQPAAGANRGVAPFRLDAAVLLGAALLLGLGILAAVRTAPKFTGAAIALHAMVAMFGLAILAAYASLG